MKPVWDAAGLSRDAGFYSCCCSGRGPASPARPVGRLPCSGPSRHGSGPALVGVAWAEKRRWAPRQEGGQPRRSRMGWRSVEQTRTRQAAGVSDA